MSTNDEIFYEVLTSVVKNFKKTIESIDNNKIQLSKKIINIKELIYHKIIKLKCSDSLEKLSKYGSINLNEFGDIRLIDIKESDSDIINNQISVFDNCYKNNSLNIANLNNNLEEYIDDNFKYSSNLIMQCKEKYNNSLNSIDLKNCLSNALKLSLKNYQFNINKLNMEVDSIQNQII